MGRTLSGEPRKGRCAGDSGGPLPGKLERAAACILVTGIVGFVCSILVLPACLWSRYREGAAQTPRTWAQPLTPYPTAGTAHSWSVPRDLGGRSRGAFIQAATVSMEGMAALGEHCFCPQPQPFQWVLTAAPQGIDSWAQRVPFPLY